MPVGPTGITGEQGLGGLLRREQATFLHPLSGALMLGLDWLLFGGELLSGFALGPLLVPLGALLGFLGTFAIERVYARRARLRSVLAALLGAVVVGVPFPVTGTVLGALVLVLAGLRARR